MQKWMLDGIIGRKIGASLYDTRRSEGTLEVVLATEAESAVIAATSAERQAAGKRVVAQLGVTPHTSEGDYVTLTRWALDDLVAAAGKVMADGQ